MGYLNYQDLLVWQKAIELVKEVYSLVKLLPAEERFGLGDQMRRAAISIPSNIAEGEARKSRKEFANFLSIANGSRAELETQLIIATQLEYIDKGQTKPALSLCAEISKMLFALIQSIENE